VGKLKEADILRTSNSSNLDLIEEAEVPTAPSSPDIRRNLLLGAAAGLFLGCLLAFVLDYLDQTVRTEEDLRGILELKVLSVIPESEQTEVWGIGFGEKPPQPTGRDSSRRPGAFAVNPLADGPEPERGEPHVRHRA
jgi:hypothetical protein